MSTVTTMNIEELYPAPFPEDAPVIDLEKISVQKLLDGDAAECKKMFEICTKEGFFYLNMMDHPKGQRMWEDACIACKVGHETLPNRSVEEKRMYKVRDRIGVFDRG